MVKQQNSITIIDDFSVFYDSVFFINIIKKRNSRKKMQQSKIWEE